MNAASASPQEAAIIDAGASSSDFFDVHSGTALPLEEQSARKLRLRDGLYDLMVRTRGGLARVRRRAASGPSKRILVVGVEVPSRAADIHRVVDALRAGSRHEVVASIAPMGDRGKFANIDAAIASAPEPLQRFDWLVITDDDIAFAPGFLDDLVALADVGDLAIAQPAHAFRSHASYAITRRRWNSLVRRTVFVEIGPLTLFRADTFATFVPFPPSRWCYGIDLVWTELAERQGLRMGIVDGTPVRHLRPVAGSYGVDDAIAEGRALLGRFGIHRRRDDLWKTNEVLVTTG